MKKIYIVTNGNADSDFETKEDFAVVEPSYSSNAHSGGAVLLAESPEEARELITKHVKTFTVYRTKAKEVVNEIERSNYNDPDQPQFEGIEFHDGTVAIRWFTETRSMSFWNSIEDLKKVHIYAHPDYGTRIEWSEGATSTTIEEL